MGSAVDRENLTAELETLAAAGFGGVEVTSIYGVRGYEHAFVPYLSDRWLDLDRKSTRLNSSHSQISYAVFCLKKKKNTHVTHSSVADLDSPTATTPCTFFISSAYSTY